MSRAPRSADLTVVVLTRNPGPELRACLASVDWAGEIVVVDDGSSEEVRALLRAHDVVVIAQDRQLIRRHEGNFDVARNAGFDRARGQWLLVLDADETVSPQLREEILGVVESGERAAFEIPRLNLFWGRPSRVLGEDRQLRLFPRGTARYRGTRLDRPPEVDCPIRALGAPIVHHQRMLLRKLRQRTDQRAHRAARAGEIPATSSLSLFWHHLRWYAVEQAAWREGPRGVVLAALYAAYPALEAAKTRRLLRSGEAGS